MWALCLGLKGLLLLSCGPCVSNPCPSPGKPGLGGSLHFHRPPQRGGTGPAPCRRAVILQIAAPWQAHLPPLSLPDEKQPFRHHTQCPADSCMYGLAMLNSFSLPLKLLPARGEGRRPRPKNLQKFGTHQDLPGVTKTVKCVGKSSGAACMLHSRILGCHHHEWAHAGMGFLLMPLLLSCRVPVRDPLSHAPPKPQ